jgi:uroporphyrinogen-III decarboxylase
MNPVSVIRGGKPETVQEAAHECHALAGARFIVGAGCEIPPDTPPENLRALGEYAWNHKPDEF